MTSSSIYSTIEASSSKLPYTQSTSTSTGSSNSKLKLKETPTERAERKFRKERKRLRKESKKVFRANGLSLDDDNKEGGGRGRYWDGFDDTPEAPRATRGEARTPPRDFSSETISPPRKKAKLPTPPLEEENEGDPLFNPSEYPPLKALKERKQKLEDLQFRQKLFDLMGEGEDDQLGYVGGVLGSDGRRGGYVDLEREREVEEDKLRLREEEEMDTMGGIAGEGEPYIPQRWRTNQNHNPLFNTNSKSSSTPLTSREQSEAHAEQIRQGMFALKNKPYLEEQARLRAEKNKKDEERKQARVRQEKEEKRRIEVLTREKGREEERRRAREVEGYVKDWERLKASWEKRSSGGEEDGPVEVWTFKTLPWPIFRTSPGTAFSPSLLSNSTAIHEFLTFLSTNPISTTTATSTSTPTTNTEEEQKSSFKKILREAILAYHPDRFLGRYLDKVIDKQEERDAVRDGVGRVSRVINEIMGGM